MQRQPWPVGVWTKITTRRCFLQRRALFVKPQELYTAPLQNWHYLLLKGKGKWETLLSLTSDIFCRHKQNPRPFQNTKTQGHLEEMHIMEPFFCSLKRRKILYTIRDHAPQSKIILL